MKTITDTVTDIDILARTIYGEARGCLRQRDGGLAALIAVANVVMNRVVQQTWYGKSIREVCLKPYQFSCWNENDANRPVILNVAKGRDKVFDVCYEVAENVIAGRWPDLTQGSDHYYAVWIPKSPVWSIGHVPVAKIGVHVFFRLTNTRR